MGVESGDVRRGWLVLLVVAVVIAPVGAIPGPVDATGTPSTAASSTDPVLVYGDGSGQLATLGGDGSKASFGVPADTVGAMADLEANGVTLVVAGEVSSDLREQAEEWDVSIVDEAELRDLPEPIDFGPFLDGDGSTTSDAPAETEPDAPPAEWFETSPEDPSTDAAESPAGSADDTTTESTDESAADSRSEPELVPGESSSDASIAVEGAGPEHVESTLERFERRTLALEAGALLLEVVLAALLVAVVGYLLIQVAALA